MSERPLWLEPREIRLSEGWAETFRLCQSAGFPLMLEDASIRVLLVDRLNPGVIALEANLSNERLDVIDAGALHDGEAHLVVRATPEDVLEALKQSDYRLDLVMSLDGMTQVLATSLRYVRT